MRKFTNIQKEHFRHLVFDCIVQRLTTQESLLYVKDKLGIEIGADHFNHVRAELKQDVKKNLKYLQKDRFVYISEFFDRREEIRFIQKRLWRMIQDNPDKPILQKSCLSELHQSTIMAKKREDNMRDNYRIPSFLTETAGELSSNTGGTLVISDLTLFASSKIICATY